MNHATNTPTELDEDHDQMFAELCKDPTEILNSMTPGKMHLLHMAAKLCSEAGELMDAVGKLCFYNQPFDNCNAVEEQGDIEFYLRGIRRHMNITRAMVLDANIKKLRRRYAKGYSDKAAQERVDKQPQPCATTPQQ